MLFEDAWLLKLTPWQWPDVPLQIRREISEFDWKAGLALDWGEANGKIVKEGLVGYCYHQGWLRCIWQCCRAWLTPSSGSRSRRPSSRLRTSNPHQLLSEHTISHQNSALLYTLSHKSPSPAPFVPEEKQIWTRFFECKGFHRAVTRLTFIEQSSSWLLGRLESNLGCIPQSFRLTSKSL